MANILRESNRKQLPHHKRLFRYLFLTGLLLIAFTFGALFQAYAFDHTESSLPSPEARILVIESGDTLWSIAQQYSSPKKDLRVYINQIKKKNKMSSAALQVGQIIILPD